MNSVIRADIVRSEHHAAFSTFINRDKTSSHELSIHIFNSPPLVALAA